MVIHGGQDQYGQRQDMWVLDMNRFEWILVRRMMRVMTLSR